MYKTEEDFLNTFSKFKNAEKHYRGLKPPFKDSRIIDFSNSAQLENHKISREILYDEILQKSFEVFRFSFPPGFIVVKECLSIDEQMTAALQCINELKGSLNR